MLSHELGLGKAVYTGKKREEIANFIPISCHYDKEHLITKGGDLLCTLSITGFNEVYNENANIESLRSRVRAALIKHVDTHKVAVHLHIIREYRNITPKGVIPFGLAATVNNAWCKGNRWDRYLVNTLYITLIYQGPKVSVFDPKSLLHGAMKRKYAAHWEVAVQKLVNISNALCLDFADMGAKKMSIVETKNGAVSEPLSFYHYLTHMKEQQIFAPLSDLAEHIADIDIEYQFNSMQIIDSTNSSNYLAIYSLKESIGTAQHIYDEFLQSNMRFIISDVMIFVDKNKALKGFADYKEILEMGRSPTMADKIGVNMALSSDQGAAADFCSYQVNILLYDESLPVVQHNINKACAIFSKCGLMVVREDFNMARCFWAILPGNTNYLCRLKYGATNTLCNFSSIHSGNMGQYAGSKWGPPVSLLKTKLGTPFYFNFHKNENGNTMIVAPNGGSKTSLCKFLIAQSVRLEPCTIYIDMQGESEKFIKGIGGDYVSIDMQSNSPLKLFPFDAELFYGNKEWLKQWLYDAAGINGDKARVDAKVFIEALVDKILLLSSVSERQQSLLAILDDVANNPSMGHFTGIMKKEIYDAVYNTDNMSILSSKNIVGINLSKIENPLLRKSFLMLLLLKMGSKLDNSPTIIVVNDASTLLETAWFAEAMNKWLQNLTEKNAIAVLEMQNSKSIQANPALGSVMKNFATQIFMSNNFVNKDFKYAYNLNDWEMHQVKSYVVTSRMFLIKQGSAAEVCSFASEGMQEILGEAL